MFFCTFPLCNSIIIIIQLLELRLACCSGNVCVQEVGLWPSKVGTYGKCVRIRLLFCIYVIFGSGGNLKIFFLQEYLPRTWGKDVIGSLRILSSSLSHSIVIFNPLIVSCCYWASWFKWIHFWLGFRNCWVQIWAEADYLGLVFLLLSLVFSSKCSDNTSKQAMTVSFHVRWVSCKCMKWERVFYSQLILLPSVWMIDFKLNELESWGSLKQPQSAWLKFCRPHGVRLSWVGTSWVCTSI